jgi:hypothetical protein
MKKKLVWNFLKLQIVPLHNIKREGDFGTMPSRAKNSAIVEVTDLPVTSQLNGWLEGRRTRFSSIVEQNCW